MALLDQLEARFLTPILDRLKAAFAPFRRLFDLVGNVFHGVQNCFTGGKRLADSIVAEISAWRNFREAIPVRTGVVSLPKAIENTQALLDQVRTGWDRVVDLAQEVRDLITRAGEADPAAEASQAAEDIEASGIKTILQKFPKLVKGLEKLVGFLAILLSVFDNISRAIDDLQAIVEAVAAIRDEIETGSTVFLSQRNPRKMVELTDGTRLNIRLGNLHEP